MQFVKEIVATGSTEVDSLQAKINEDIRMRGQHALKLVDIFVLDPRRVLLLYSDGQS